MVFGEEVTSLLGDTVGICLNHYEKNHRPMGEFLERHYGAGAWPNFFSWWGTGIGKDAGGSKDSPPQLLQVHSL